MPAHALEDLFVQELEELYDAEKQIYTGLGVMAKAAANSELKAAFQTHRKQTKDHICRLESGFRILGESPSRGNAPGVSGLIKQGKVNGFDPAVGDASLIASAQKIEHYEIAGYGCARTHAELLGYREVAELLAGTLQEEEETDALLTSIAQNSVNPTAAAAPYAKARTGSRHDLPTTPSGGDEGGLSLGKLAMGVAIGGALSVLFAPCPGSATRGRIVNSVRHAVGSLKGA